MNQIEKSIIHLFSRNRIKKDATLQIGFLKYNRRESGMMINDSEIQDILKDLFNQYGAPDDSNIKLYTSIINNSLVNNPEERKIIELSIEEKIPFLLNENRNNSQNIEKLSDGFSSNKKVDIKSAKWVVMIWASAMGINIHTSTIQSNNNKNGLNLAPDFSNDDKISPDNHSKIPIVPSPEVKTQANTCENCGKKWEEGAKFCKYCGSTTMTVPSSEVKTQTNTCKNCGKKWEEGAKFCKYCGSTTMTVPSPEVKTQTNTCENCGKELEEGAKFCKYCGSTTMTVPSPEVRTQTNICEICGKELEKGAKFCKYCGSKKKLVQTQKKIEKEYRRTCNRCGTVWHSLVSRENSFKWFVLGEVISSAVSPSNVLTCGMCGEFAGRHKKDKIRNKQNKMDRLRACPKCNSHDYNEEIIEYEI